MLLSACVGQTVEEQRLRVTIDPPAHAIRYRATLVAAGAGRLVCELHPNVTIVEASIDGSPTKPMPVAGGRIAFELGAAHSTIELSAEGRFEQDPAAGERPGAIHNFSVDASIADGGVFLSDGAAWHPRPLDAEGRPQLHTVAVEIAPIEGWAFVASGDPVGDGPLTEPRWSWRSPRGLDGLALAGNRHTLFGSTHETKDGPVEIVMHTTPDRAPIAAMYLKAAASYLDLYVPRLGRFPFRRFSIVENFFSSGFAYPGFTLLGPQVVAMAPRSLVAGYLDHEMLHNWWGNGVYVSPADGNWCEALTSYGANYWRRVAEGGDEAGIAFRRDLLMKLSTDPTAFDDGPLGNFGSANPSVPGPNRFVGYDKGAFVFFMLEEVLAQATNEPAARRGDALWGALRRFAAEHMGRRAGWAEIQRALEAAAPDRPAGWLDGFMAHWVRGHPVPTTVVPGAADPVAAFVAQYPTGTGQAVDVRFTQGGERVEIDPRFRLYRTLPAGQLVPTIAGTTGPGGLTVVTEESRPEVTAYVPQLEPRADGENLVLIGAAAIARHAELLRRCADPITVNGTSFEIGGTRYDGATNAVLHTMQHPDRPGRTITLFHANGEAGWSRLRLMRFYTRDTSVIWEGENVIARRIAEPDRTIAMPKR